MKQNERRNAQQNYTFAVMVENSHTGEYAWLKMPTNREAVKQLFAQLQIKGNNYLISECNFCIGQIKDAILRCRNLDEVNYFAVKYAELDDHSRNKLRQILESGCDSVDSVAEAVNLIYAMDYTFFILSEVTKHEQVCEFHLACQKLSGAYVPNQYIPREMYRRIGEELAHSERGKLFEGNYIAKTRNYYPDTYNGKIPMTYKVTDYR